MNGFQTAVKYFAIALAVLLIVSIFGGILGAVNIVTYVTDKNTTDGNIVADITTYPVSENVTELKVDITAADFTIKTGDKLEVESNLKQLSVRENNGVLKITEKSKFNITGGYNGAMLTLYIPYGWVFDKADISSGAGVLKIDSLTADKLCLDLGAGKADIDNVTANTASEIEGGAGAINIKNASLRNLDLEIGVGELNMIGLLSGDCDIEQGVGATDITLIGTADDYTVHIDKGLGDVRVDGEQVSDNTSYGTGKNKISIDGGVGKISVSFIDNKIN